MRSLVFLLAISCSGPAPEPTPAFELHFAPGDVQPGAEGIHCLGMPGPDHDVYVSGWRVELAGAHHTDVWMQPPGQAPIHPALDTSCTMSGTSYVLGSARPELEEEFGADGAALLIPARSRLVVLAHYLNAASEPVPEVVTISFSGAATHTRDVLGFALTEPPTVPVKPGETRTVSFRASFATPIQWVTLMGHSHAHSTLETMTVGGAEVYRSTTWEEPPTVHPSALVTQEGVPVEWSCTVANDSAKALTWGENRVNESEMCHMFGLFIGDVKATVVQGVAF